MYVNKDMQRPVYCCEYYHSGTSHPYCFLILTRRKLGDSFTHSLFHHLFRNFLHCVQAMKYKTRPDQRSIGTILWQKKHYLTIYFLTKTKQQQRNTTLSTHFNYDEPKQPLLHWEEVETKKKQKTQAYMAFPVKARASFSTK